MGGKKGVADVSERELLWVVIVRIRVVVQG